MPPQARAVPHQGIPVSQNVADNEGPRLRAEGSKLDEARRDNNSSNGALPPINN